MLESRVLTPRASLRAILALCGLAAALACVATAQAQVGTTWTARASPVTDQLNESAYGNGVYVAVGSNAVITSADGITWTAVTPAPTGQWYSVVFGDGRFVAVGANKVMTSTNGTTWTVAARTGIWQSVTYGGGRFVAVGDSVAMTSTDGVVWTAAPSMPLGTWASVAYDNGTFVAVSYNSTGRVITSADGASWTAANSATYDNAKQWSAVTYGDGKFVAVAQYDGGANIRNAMTSPNGTAWTPQTTPEIGSGSYSTRGPFLQSVAYGSGLFVAVAPGGGYTGTTDVRMITSSDAITWNSNLSSTTINGNWNGVSHAYGLFVVVGANGTVITSGTLLPPPGTPPAPTATAGDREATVAVAAASTGGAPTSFTVTASPGGATCTVTAPATSCTVTGLTNGTAYTFTATATNAAGTSGASPASAAVTPTAVTPTTPSTVTPKAVGTVKLLSSPVTGKTGISVRFQTSGAGRIVVRGTYPTRATRVACTARATVSKAGTQAVVCRFNARTRATLAARSLRILVRATFTPTGGTAVSTSRTVPVKRFAASVRPVRPDVEPVTG